MTNQCPCGEPADNAFLGKRCAGRLERALGDLPALIADLDITLTRQSVTGAQSADGGKPTKKDAQPLPLNLGAGDVAADLRHTLVSAVRHLTEARGITAVPADTPVAMSAWLLKYHRSIPLDPAGPDIAEAVHAVTARIMAVIDLPTSRGRFKVGMCPETDAEGTLCPGEVWVHLPAEDLGRTATMECRVCHHVYEPIQWTRAGQRILKRGAA